MEPAPIYSFFATSAETGEAKGGKKKKGISVPVTFPISTGFGSQGGGGLSILFPVNCLIEEQCASRTRLLLSGGLRAGSEGPVPHHRAVGPRSGSGGRGEPRGGGRGGGGGAPLGGGRRWGLSCAQQLRELWKLQGGSRRACEPSSPRGSAPPLQR